MTGKEARGYAAEMRQRIERRNRQFEVHKERLRVEVNLPQWTKRLGQELTIWPERIGE